MNQGTKPFVRFMLIMMCVVLVTGSAFAATGTFHQKYDPWPNKTIPDNGGYANRVTLEINASGVPSNAKITSVKYTCWVNHPYRGDLCVDLTAYLNSQWVSHRISQYEGGSAINIDETETFTVTRVRLRFFDCVATCCNENEL